MNALPDSWVASAERWPHRLEGRFDIEAAIDWVKRARVGHVAPLLIMDGKVELVSLDGKHQISANGHMTADELRVWNALIEPLGAPPVAIHEQPPGVVWLLWFVGLAGGVCAGILIWPL